MKLSKANIQKIAAFTLGLGFIAGANATDETFDANITLVAPILITETDDLNFAQTFTGSASDVITAASSADAAQFSATGEGTLAATGSIVEVTIEMLTDNGVGSTKRITVQDWTYGGDLTAVTGVTAFVGGALGDMRVGATAKVEADDISGTYLGTATFRLTYN